MDPETTQIVLLEGQLVALTRDDALSLVWHAKMPNWDSTRYVAFEWLDGKLFANTWEGWRAEIDPASGRILNATFVK